MQQHVSGGWGVCGTAGHGCTDNTVLILNLQFWEEIASLQEQLWFASTLLRTLLQQMYRGCGLTAEVRIRLLNQITLAHGGWV